MRAILGPSLALAVPALLAAQAPTALERRVDSLFSAFASTQSPGCAVGVDRAGVPLLRRAYGMANLETSTAWTVGTISESGSVAKQFVAAALVLLARDGVLSLDDDVTRWVPEVRGIGKPMTVRQLLSHTSGLPDRYAFHDVEGRPAGVVDHPNDEVLDIVSRLRHLNFDPGEDYLYSNTGYVVAVAVLERASRQSLQQFTQARIFGPLGMRSTRWREDHRSVVPGRASAYSGTMATGFRNEHPFTRVFGSGGLLVTVDDFLTWANAMQQQSGEWRAVADSLSATIRLNDGTALTYGLGVTSDAWRGLRRVSHTGSTGGYRASLDHFPEHRVSVALLCNVGSANPGALASSVSAAVLGDALQPVPAIAAPAIAVLPDALHAIAGRYHAPRTEQVLILVVRDGSLVDSLTNTVYVPSGANRFRPSSGGTRELLVSGEGDRTSLRVQAPNTRPVDYQRVGLPNVSAPQLAAYAGSYRSAELDASLTIVVREGQLWIDQGWRGSTPLAPLFADGFRLPRGEILRFTRDARGRVNGINRWADRVRKLRFERVAVR
jgi:CubicO group peptidase (beta-lactamase class C family)